MSSRRPPHVGLSAPLWPRPAPQPQIAFQELNGAASPTNCARKIAGPLTVLAMIVSFPIFLLAVLVFQPRTRATTYLVIVLSGISSLAGRPCPACCDALAVAVLDLAISLIALTGGTGLGNAL